MKALRLSNLKIIELELVNPKTILLYPLPKNKLIICMSVTLLFSFTNRLGIIEIIRITSSNMKSSIQKKLKKCNREKDKN